MRSFSKIFSTVSLGTAFLISCSAPQTNTDQKKSETVISNSQSANINAESESAPCNCVDTTIVTANYHLFPFTDAKKIIVYRFSDKVVKGSPEYEDIIKGGTFQRKKIEEKKTLNKEQSLELEKIFFNKVSRNPMCDSLHHSCIYNPHHCIVFYDANGRAFAFLEICFICNDRMTNPKWNFGPFCGDTYCQLRKLLKHVGFDPKELNSKECEELNSK